MSTPLKMPMSGPINTVGELKIDNLGILRVYKLSRQLSFE